VLARAPQSPPEGVVIIGLDHVQLAAPEGCEARARAFYGELLRLVELPKPAPLSHRGGVWFALGAGQQLHVGVDPAFAAARKAHPALALASKAALVELAAALERAGHTVSWDADLPGAARFYLDDPFGNRLELLVREGAGALA
jgi:catechol 2,3-dioxygenase-like lactoylglutathione lyase family enzyme